MYNIQKLDKTRQRVPINNAMPLKAAKLIIIIIIIIHLYYSTLKSEDTEALVVKVCLGLHI